jgi:hypothetical protein
LLSMGVALIYIPTNSVEVFLFPHILTSICCCLYYWWQPFWLGWGGISMYFWFAFPFPLCSRILSISSYVYQQYVCLLSRITCSVHLPIYSVGCWFFKKLVFELLVYSGY